MTPSASSLNYKGIQALSEYSLLHYQYNKYSQRGDDGIINKIFEQLHIVKGYFIEFGAVDGIKFSNCRVLFEKGWSGCYIESDKESYEKLKENYKDEKNILCLNYQITPNNKGGKLIDAIKAEYFSNVEIDLLIIDIDGRDYEILDSLRMQPKVISVEGGFSWHPHLTKKVPKVIAKDNLQQPLAVGIKIGKKKGYEPICFNANLFLLRKDLYDANPYFHKIKNDAISMWKEAYFSVLTDEDRKWLNDKRQNDIKIRRVEGKKYKNLFF